MIGQPTLHPDLEPKEKPNGGIKVPHHEGFIDAENWDFRATGTIAPLSASRSVREYYQTNVSLSWPVVQGYILRLSE